MPQAQAVLYETEAMQLREELKQTAGRLNHANSQTADLLQQLRAQQAENASLLGQVAQSHGRDTEAASAHRALQEALDRMTREHARLVGFPCLHAHASQPTCKVAVPAGCSLPATPPTHRP